MRQPIEFGDLLPQFAYKTCHIRTVVSKLLAPLHPAGYSSSQGAVGLSLKSQNERYMLGWDEKGCWFAKTAFDEN